MDKLKMKWKEFILGAWRIGDYRYAGGGYL